MTWAAGCWLGMGGAGVVVNDGIAVELSTMQVEVELEDTPAVVELTGEIEVELTTPVIEVEIVD